MPAIGRGAAEYNVPVTAQKNLSADDSTGQPIANWVTQFPLWVQIVPRGGKGAWIFEQLRTEISHVVRARFSAQTKLILPSAWRFLLPDGSALFVDARTNPNLRNIEFEFGCIEQQISG